MNNFQQYETIVRAPDLPDRLAKRLQLPLPGALAQRDLEPELSYGRHAGPTLPDARPAAVVVLLTWRSGQWHVPLMERPMSLSSHAGQISLPGGVIERDETSEEAALRELEEELGLDRFRSLLLGQLSPMYVYATNFTVAPWSAVVREPVLFQPNPAEVASVLEVPLATFLDDAYRGVHVEKRGTLDFSAPHYRWRGYRIWGATSMILAEFAAAVREVANQ